MAGKTQTNSASGSPQTIFLVISNCFPVPCEMKIVIFLCHFVVHSNYKRFRCSDNIAWNAKMAAEHVGAIAKTAWPTDGIPTGLSAHGYQASPHSLYMISSLPQRRFLSLSKRIRFFFAKLKMEPMYEDNDERTKTKRVYDERVLDKVVSSHGGRRLRQHAGFRRRRDSVRAA